MQKSLNFHRLMMAAACMAAAASSSQYASAAIPSAAGAGAKPETKPETKTTTIELHAVDSSQIDAIGHNGESTMHVKFKGGTTYEYQNVDVDRYNAIKGADSVGKAFNSLVKFNPTAYPYTKL